jgi:lipopolysaccharide export system permease protein
MSLPLINFYIAKSFLMRFGQIVFGFSILIFFINLLDLLERVRDSDAALYNVAFMALLQIPHFLNDVISSLVLIAAMINFFLLSSKSEITVIRISGFSLWQLLRPMAISALVLGIFWITAFDLLAIQMSKKFSILEGKYTRNDSREVISPANGLWIKQVNVDAPDEEVIIKSKKVFKENMEFKKATFWFFDKDGQFYKKIDAEEMHLDGNYWNLKDVTINDEKNINKNLKNLKISTNLEADFVMQKVVTNFQNVQLFSIFELPSLISDLQNAGFNPTKFKVYFHSLLSKPLLFLAMVLIACYFGLNHVRNSNTVVMIFFGIVVGLIFYITSSIINSLGSSSLIPIFASTWVIVIICLSIGTLLIYSKENL